MKCFYCKKYPTDVTATATSHYLNCVYCGAILAEHMWRKTT